MTQTFGASSLKVLHFDESSIRSLVHQAIVCSAVRISALYLAIQIPRKLSKHTASRSTSWALKILHIPWISKRYPWQKSITRPPSSTRIDCAKNGLWSRVCINYLVAQSNQRLNHFKGGSTKRSCQAFGKMEVTIHKRETNKCSSSMRLTCTTKL